MKNICIAILVILSVACAHAQQQECPYGYASEKAADGLEAALHKAPSCKAATAILRACYWGSSADVGFAGIVIQKCEPTFINKLTPLQLANFQQEIDLCTYENDRQGGTMYMSAASACHVDVTARYAANPHEGDKPVPRASFDCSKAHLPLEKAICSDKKLGEADMVLGRVYKSALVELITSPEKPALVADERLWLQTLPARCSLTSRPTSHKPIGCIRNEFEIRFTVLDMCIDENDAFMSCMKSTTADLRKEK